jgi:lipocalin
MTRLRFITVIVFLLSYPLASSAFIFQWLFGPSCKTISSVDDFDLEAYISRSWYIQRQQVNTYQSKEDLFCVVATYDDESKSQWFQLAYSVRNYSNKGGVNQDSQTNGMVLCATQTGRAGQLVVAPCFLPSLFGGPYWVVATDYVNYAIVTAGKLTTRGSCDNQSGLCTTLDEASIFDPLSFVGNNQGLWFFTRAQMPSSQVMNMMEAKAVELGICTADMVAVVQQGCSYAGARIK